MKKSGKAGVSAAVCAALIAGAFCGWVCAQEPGKEPAPVDTAKVKELVAKLGDDDFQTREDATAELIAMGPDVADLVEAETESSKDPEVGSRVRQIVSRYVSDPAWKEKLEKKLAESCVSVNLNDASWYQILDGISESGEINIVSDPRVEELFYKSLSFGISRLRVCDTLKLLIEQYGPEGQYALLDGVVMVSTQEDLDAWPADPLEGFVPKTDSEKRVVKRLGMRVELDAREPESLSDIIAKIKDMTKVNIVIDASADATAAGADFSKTTRIVVKELPAFQALNLVLKPYGLSYCVRDGGVFVSAKSIIDNQSKK